MTKNEYKAMLKDILDNDTEYEYKYKDDEFWIPVDITDVQLFSNYEYRKKQSKPWLEENYPDFDDEEGLNRSARNGIKDFYEEFMKRAKLYKEIFTKGYGSYDVIYAIDFENLKLIANGMGVIGNE